MNWYLVPVCTVHTDFYHPGEEDDGSVCPDFLLGMKIYAYDPDPRTLLDSGDADNEKDDIYAVPVTCLVYIVSDESARPGWVSLTEEEASTYFQTVTGNSAPWEV